MMFDSGRRDDRQPWFGTMIGVGPASPWWDEPSTTWERPIRYTEPTITKPRGDAWWRRLFHLFRRDAR
jgi:hypothetical protein